MPDVIEDVEVEVEVVVCERYSCSIEFPATEGEDVAGCLYCPSCVVDYAVTCDRCGDYADSYDVRDVEGETWCEHCSDYYSSYCDYCDVTFADGSWSHSDCGGNDSVLLEYNETPLLMFHGEDPHKAFLGVEIEMEDSTGHSIDTAVSGVTGMLPLDHFFYKSDGSLHDGMEMVSHPMSLSYWKGFADTLGKATAYLKSVGMRSWNTETAGFHVHISAAAFADSERHLWLFQQMFYRNPQSITKFAGRESTQWGRLQVAPGDVGYYTKARKNGRGFDLNRYMAVNLTNSSTVEIRVFRGSLNPTRIMANIELVHAIATYTRDLTFASVKHGALKFDVFAYWMSQQGDVYANASAHINSKKISGLDSPLS